MTMANLLPGTGAVTDLLAGISASLTEAALSGAMTARRLADIAAAKSAGIDPENPMEQQEDLQAISALTKMANEAASLGLSMMAAASKAKPKASAPESGDGFPKWEFPNVTDIKAAK
jgi:hypothetical protein